MKTETKKNILTTSSLKLTDTINDRSYLRSLIDKSIKIRKISPQNIVCRLRSRETNTLKSGFFSNSSNCFYTNVVPGLTVIGVEKPPCFLRKFTPNGKYFIAFSADQTSLEIYEFRGSQAAGELLKDVRGDHLPFNNDPVSINIRSSLFSTFFTLKHTVSVSTSNEGLNRECSLFTDDSRYVIVGSTVTLPDEPYPLYRDMYQNNESLSPNVNIPLEDCSIHVVHIESGMLCDAKKFRCDKIYLSHNQGISLFNRTLSVLSVQHQTIHIYQLTDDGKLVEMRKLGRFCYDDDQHAISLLSESSSLRNRSKRNPSLVSSSNLSTSNFTSLRFYATISMNSPSSSLLTSAASMYNHPIWGGSDNFLCSLKHRLLVHLYYSAIAEDRRVGSRAPLLEFHRNFDFYCKLKMWKMQLLDETHLLIKYTTEDVIMIKTQDYNQQISFFAVFDTTRCQFIAFYDNASPSLLSLSEDYTDFFRNSGNPTNIYTKNLNYRFRQGISNIKQGSRMIFIKRVLSQLPISSQSYSFSPYLDTALFSYDDKWLNSLERPKNSGDHAIKFNARDSGLLKFKIYTGFVGAKNVAPPPPALSRRLVAFTFHPFEPFAISVQRTNADYVVNFHVVPSDGCHDDEGCSRVADQATVIYGGGSSSSANNNINPFVSNYGNNGNNNNNNNNNNSSSNSNSSNSGSSSSSNSNGGRIIYGGSSYSVRDRIGIRGRSTIRRSTINIPTLGEGEDV